MGRLSLPEELTLLHRNRAGGSHGLPGPAVAAGVLAELDRLGKIQLADPEIHVVDPQPTAVPMFDGVLEQLANRGEPTGILSFLCGQEQLHENCLDQLTQLGCLRAEERLVLWLFPVQRYWPHQSTLEEIITPVWNLLRGSTEPDGRAQQLAALLYGSGAGDALFREHADRKALRQLTQDDLLGLALLKLRTSRTGARGGPVHGGMHGGAAGAAGAAGGGA